ncbi:MAG: hypothetical protein JXA68_00305 [Ignavibacteriales bacterium]|nr:hypothetical protein [Ignavibacteriales bacterium]
MKRIILFAVFLVTCIFAYSQNQDSINNFYIENNRVIWKKVFITSLDFEQLFSKAKDAGLFENVEKEQTKIRGQLKYIDAEPLEYGFLDLNAAPYVNNNFINGFVVIEFKQGRYRVTLRRIMLTEKHVDTLNILGASSLIEREIFKLGKIEFNNQFKNRSSILLNDMLTQYFDFSQMICDDNW